MRHPANFPILDSELRDELTDGRTLLSEHGAIDPYVVDMDDWCSMPVRVSHNDSAGVVIEIGPYTLDHYDVNHLRAAVRAYDVASNGNTIRRVQ